MNRAEIDALPAVVDVNTAARVMGLSRNRAYQLVRANEWPTPVLRIGKLIRIPTAPMLDLLGINQSAVRTSGVSGSPTERRHAG